MIFRYGFNGQEKTDEIAGAGNHTTAEFWEYDTRIGRRWNLDPKPIVGISLYSAFNNNPIFFNDPRGDSTPNERVMAQHPEWFLKPNRDGDQTGQIRNATHEEYQENPLGAFGKDIFHFAADVIGANTLDDESVKVISIGRSGSIDGWKAADIGFAVLNVGLAIEGERPSEKLPPNPWGKLGGPAHREVVQQVAEELRTNGYEVNFERKVETPDGIKSRRFIDVEGVHKETKEARWIQVGKQNLNGKPVSREQKALDDINAATGFTPEFRPYNKTK